MRSITLSNIVAATVAQALALVLGCTSAWAVWFWLTAAQPFK